MAFQGKFPVNNEPANRFVLPNNLENCFCLLHMSLATCNVTFHTGLDTGKLLRRIDFEKFCVNIRL